LLQIAQNIGHGYGIAPIALEHMMSNRPTVDHHQADQHLRIARLLVSTVAIGAKTRRPIALKIS
jgi:hypothetical protein